MNTDFYKKIDDYLNEKLSAEEFDAFQNALAYDSTLAAEVELYRLEKKGTERLREQNLRETMKKWQKITDNPEHKNSPNTEGRSDAQKFHWWWIMLSLLFLFFLFWLFRSSQNKQNNLIPPFEDTQQTPQRPINDLPQNVPQANFNPQNGNETTPVARKNEKIINKTATNKAIEISIDALALAYYDYPKPANDVLKGGDGERTPYDYNNNSSLSKYNLAHNYFKQKNYTQAADYFLQIQQNDKGELGDNAKWYLALSLLAQGKNNESLIIINEIITENNHDKLEAAKHLKEKLSH